MCGLNEKQLRLNAGADCPEEMDELGLSIEVDDSQFEDDSKTVIEVEESTEENTNDDDNDDEPDDEIPRSANHSEVQEVNRQNFTNQFRFGPHFSNIYRCLSVITAESVFEEDLH